MIAKEIKRNLPDVTGLVKDALQSLPNIRDLIPVHATPLSAPERIYDLERRTETLEYTLWTLGGLLILIILLRGVRS